MEQTTITLKDVAEDIGRPASTIKRWIDELELEIPQDSSGTRRFAPEHLEVLRTVARMREQHGMASIRAIIGPMSPGPAQPSSGRTEPVRAELVDEDQAGPVRSEPAMALDLATLVKAAVGEAFEQNHAQVAAYGDARAHAARLEEQLRQLQARVVELEAERAQLLAAPPDASGLGDLAPVLAALDAARVETSLRVRVVAEAAAAERARLEAEHQAQLLQLQREHQAELELARSSSVGTAPARPWWKIWG